MLEQMRTSAGNRAGKTLHGKMESRIIILDSINKITYTDLNFKFFANLTTKRILWALPRFNLSARKDQVNDNVRKGNATAQIDKKTIFQR